MKNKVFLVLMSYLFLCVAVSAQYGKSKSSRRPESMSSGRAGSVGQALTGRGQASASRNQSSASRNQASAGQNQASAGQGQSVSAYDPSMDNHLLAPQEGEAIGLFGKKIAEAEKVLKKYGAKSSSYAFGKYSKMNLSVYLITMSFDKHRRVGAVSVEPRAPFKTIEPAARKFFLDLFIEGGDMSKFKAVISKTKLELFYAPASVR